jgi:3',5'-nucleoside bisphosphate phosphatase
VRYADLHVHTFYSDSTFSPEEVVRCAKEKGLAAIAICDHDSVNGIDPCMAIGAKLDVEIIPSIEMTAEKVDAEIHILGYFIDWKQDWLKEKLKEIQESRVERVYKIIGKLNAFDIAVNAEDIFKIAGKGSVGRLHIAQAVLNTGKIRSLKEVFDKYIGFLKPCYVSYARFLPKEAIGIILKAGGVPVIAHPHLMGHDEYIEEFVDYGLKGIEVYHTDHKRHVSERYEEIAKRYDLVITGGSDCHGMGKGKVVMGEVRVPYEVVETLKKESEKIKKQ